MYAYTHTHQKHMHTLSVQAHTDTHISRTKTHKKQETQTHSPSTNGFLQQWGSYSHTETTNQVTASRCREPKPPHQIFHHSYHSVKGCSDSNKTCWTALAKRHVPQQRRWPLEKRRWPLGKRQTALCECARPLQRVPLVWQAALCETVWEDFRSPNSAGLLAGELSHHRLRRALLCCSLLVFARCTSPAMVVVSVLSAFQRAYLAMCFVSVFIRCACVYALVQCAPPHSGSPHTLSQAQAAALPLPATEGHPSPPTPAGWDFPIVRQAAS